jgi:hypothetical protein
LFFQRVQFFGRERVTLDVAVYGTFPSTSYLLRQTFFGSPFYGRETVKVRLAAEEFLAERQGYLNGES